MSLDRRGLSLEDEWNDALGVRLLVVRAVSVLTEVRK